MMMMILLFYFIFDNCAILIIDDRIDVVCLRVQGKAVNRPVQNTKEITIKNGYEKIHSLFLEFVSKK